MAGLWFRIYDEALDDPRLQRLPASLFRAWFNVLCAASRNGGTLPDLPELAFMLRTRPGALSRRLEALKAAGLLDEVDAELRPVEWEKRQFVRQDAQDGAEPMSAAERTRRERRARDAAGVTGGDQRDVTKAAGGLMTVAERLLPEDLRPRITQDDGAGPIEYERREA
jgi:hypothetical protein